MAVGPGVLHPAAADGRPTAADVDDHQWLVEQLVIVDRLLDGAGEGIGPATGRKRDDQLDGTAGILGSAIIIFERAAAAACKQPQAQAKR